MKICEQNGVLLVMRAIGYIIYFAKILVPVLLIIMGVIDLFKVLTSDDEKSYKDETVKFMKRIIAGLVIFFIPTILGFLLDFVYGADGVMKDSDFAKCNNCIFHPNKTNKCNPNMLGK